MSPALGCARTAPVSVRLLALVFVLAGCASAPPPTPAPTLAALDTRLFGETVTVVRLDGSVTEPFRLLRLTGEFVRGDSGVIDRRTVAIPTASVREIRLAGRPDVARGAAYGVAGALPGSVSIGIGFAIRPDGPDEGSTTASDILIGAGVATAMLGIGLGVAAGAKPEPVVFRIAPLSRFADAPREGVGLR